VSLGQEGRIRKTVPCYSFTAQEVTWCYLKVDLGYLKIYIINSREITKRSINNVPSEERKKQLYK
jgi:citrate lyase synthetase